ncbi:MAG: phosphoethanolamine transferase [Gammaproteobacteria bacterium]|uniref:phosphoethanolamine transferase n=1 Tax=uncultured Pseudacidovorax sp. TaxID=679313 RepID=UPI0025D4A5D4|nr:phosphoethanolamine--lipid A transferase [uncultured Pseudacidovorax sp.]
MIAADATPDAGTGTRRKGLSPLFSCLGVAGWIVLLDNVGFWRTFLSAQPGSRFDQWTAAAGLASLLILLMAGLLRPLVGNRVGLTVVAVLLVISAGVAHYVDGWGVLVDRNLIRNVVETDAREVSELLSWSAAVDVLLRGVVPAVLLLLLPLASSSGWRTLGQTGLLLAGATSVGMLLTVSLYGTLATTFRNHRELRLQLVPANYIRAVYGHFKGNIRSPVAPMPVASDAWRAPRPDARPKVMVLMVGETARAANFSLGGYGRDTNRHLAGTGAVYFPNVASCGTDTATSLPCMFSNLGAGAFSVGAAQARENVLDVLARAGVRVSWLENNSGCKGVCTRVPTQAMPVAAPPERCGTDGCHDEILLPALQRELDQAREDRLVVLHMMGSHGPSYYKRYPAPGPFQPTCDTNRIQSCGKAELVNTYDNTIDYTSKVIAEAIRIAERHAQSLDVAVFYVSDHGESLGENNIYLHGIPPLLAPREQKEVPMIGWLSSSAAQAAGLTPKCLPAVAGRAFSHDNLFHSLLGFHGVKTGAYRAELDLFAIAKEDAACLRS